jgi:ATP-dependent helicase/nuclease subunit A
VSADPDSLYAFRNNLVVTASAGTGKTFRLVALYSLLSLGLTSRGQRDATEASDPVVPSRIAATTFSRAAAAEIRERVERVLRAVAQDEFDASTLAYRAIFEMRAQATRSSSISSRSMRDRAEAALADLPHALIDTLHGLAGRIVRSSALDLGLSPGFAILDDEGARASTEAVVEEVLSQALARGEPGATLLLDAGGGLSATRLRVAALLDRADEEGVAISELACTDFVPAAREWMDKLVGLCRALCDPPSKVFAEPASAVLHLAAKWPVENDEELMAAALEALFKPRRPARPSGAEEAFFWFI